MRKSPAFLRLAGACGALLCAAGASAQQQPSVQPSSGTVSTFDSRIFWVVPNYTTVEVPKPFSPLSSRDKFYISLNDSFDPYALPVVGIYAGFDQLLDQFPSYGRGWTGYGKRYAVEFGNQTISNLMTEAIFPIALHQDPRYFRLGSGGFWKRTGYAISRIFVIKTDSGGTEFNYSEFGGNAAMAGISDAYVPTQDRTFSNTAERYGGQIGLDMIFNIGKEFWPDIRRFLIGR